MDNEGKRRKKVVRKNILEEESDRRNEILRDAFSQWGVIVMGALIVIVKVYREEPLYDILSLLFGVATAAFLFMALITEEWFYIITTIIFFIFTIYCFYYFLVGVV